MQVAFPPARPPACMCSLHQSGVLLGLRVLAKPQVPRRQVQLHGLLELVQLLLWHPPSPGKRLRAGAVFGPEKKGVNFD